jgi:hypothetical protein
MSATVKSLARLKKKCLVPIVLFQTVLYKQQHSYFNVRVHSYMYFSFVDNLFRNAPRKENEVVLGPEILTAKFLYQHGHSTECWFTYAVLKEHSEPCLQSQVLY